MNEFSLNVANVDFEIKQRKILQGIDFKVRKGLVFAVVGHNGAGKTTLFHLLLGLKFQTAGEISLNGITNLIPESRARVAYIAERPYIHLEQTLRSFLNFHATLMGMKGAFKREAVEQAAREVGLISQIDYLLTTFSKGMLQKSMIAAATLGDPELIIMDEPMSGLDPEARLAVREQIAKLKLAKKTIIFSSHALEDVEQLSDEVLHLKEGKVKFLGSVNQWVSSR